MNEWDITNPAYLTAERGMPAVHMHSSFVRRSRYRRILDLEDLPITVRLWHRGYLPRWAAPLAALGPSRASRAACLPNRSSSAGLTTPRRLRRFTGAPLLPP